jgi:hypothetical protein
LLYYFYILFFFVILYGKRKENWTDIWDILDLNSVKEEIKIIDLYDYEPIKNNIEQATSHDWYFTEYVTQYISDYYHFTNRHEENRCWDMINNTSCFATWSDQMFTMTKARRRVKAVPIKAMVGARTGLSSSLVSILFFVTRRTIGTTNKTGANTDRVIIKYDGSPRNCSSMFSPFRSY